jgi:hypothetical protein
VEEELSFSSDPRASLEFLTQRPSSAVGTLLGEMQVRDVEEWTARLEMSVFVIANFEAVAELGIEDTTSLFTRHEELFAAAARRAHLDVPKLHALFAEHAPRLPMPPRSLPVANFGKLPPLVVLAPPVRSLLALCPIRRLEHVAAALGVESLGHRCRVAFEWLQSFLRRADPAIHRQAQVIAIAYSEGRLSMTEVAALLSITTSDAAAWLEEHGHCRSVATLAMADDERRKAFSLLRADRLKRAGRPEQHELMVRRDVAATQRIEGIDARPWLPEQ